MSPVLASVVALVTLHNARLIWGMNMEYVDISACVDCLLYIANGDLPEHNENLDDDIEKLWPPKRWYICVGDDDTENNAEFSWAQCDCCGSRLGGSRHELVAFKK